MDQRSKIAVVGYGIEGKAMLAYLVKHQYSNVTVCDQKVYIGEKMPKGVSVRLGEHYLEGINEFDVIFRSPGVNHDNHYLVEARLEGKEVTSPIQYFLDHCPCTVVGVTGTKGKGTTSTLIYEILKEWFGKMSSAKLGSALTEADSTKVTGKAGSKKFSKSAAMYKKNIAITRAKGGELKKFAKRHVYLGGNIGNSPIEFLDKLKGGDVKNGDVVVLELSCFQLGDLKKSPHIAVLLNTTSDHLDYYPDRDAYLQAKELILAHQDEDDLAVLNKDYEYSKYYAPLVKGRLVYVSPKGEKLDKGVYVKGLNVFDAEPEIVYVKSLEEENKEVVMKVKDVALIGSHNLENVCPAVAVAKEFGVPSSVIAKVVKRFKGLPHRLEFVRKIDGVSYYNDSFSTNPQTSMAAVDSFNVPTILIAGGSDKGLSYKEWARKILTKESLQVVLLIGATAEKMNDALVGVRKKLKAHEITPTLVLMCGDLKNALATARRTIVDSGVNYRGSFTPEVGVGKGVESKIPKIEKKNTTFASLGAVVVMSPAAASFDQFKDYKERGQKFREIVLGL